MYKKKSENLLNAPHTHTHTHTHTYIYIYIYIYTCIYKPSSSSSSCARNTASLTLSYHPSLLLLVGPLNGIQCPHRADECMFFTG